MQLHLLMSILRGFTKKMVKVKGDLHVHVVHVGKVCSQVKPNYFVCLLHAWVNTAVGQTKNV